MISTLSVKKIPTNTFRQIKKNGAVVKIEQKFLVQTNNVYQGEQRNPDDIEISNHKNPHLKNFNPAKLWSIPVEEWAELDTIIIEPKPRKKKDGPSADAS